VDRLPRPWHSGDLALETTGVRAVAGFIQKGENALPDGRCVDVLGRQAKPGTRYADEVADEVLISPLWQNQQRQTERQRT
jgi:hypothetical protein